jgi:hypothetical protein
MPELTLACGLYWRDQWMEAGSTVTYTSPEDDWLINYYKPFGAFASLGTPPADKPPAGGEPAPEGEASGEGEASAETGGTAPISTRDSPAAVGRRQRP